LKAIQDELNEGKEDGVKKEKDYAAKIEERQMPPDVKSAALEEWNKLQSQGPNSRSTTSSATIWIFFCTAMEKKRGKLINLGEARRILDEQAYGLEKVKDRIIQHLAVMQLKRDKMGSILLLVGPPGTGKTSLGKSIAEALDRKYLRLSRAESGTKRRSGASQDICRSHAGRIIQSIKKAGERNPVHGFG